MTVTALIIGVVLAASGVVFLFLANHQYWELQFELNERLPEGQKFEPTFWTPQTRSRFRQLYRTVLPGSPRPRRARRFAIIGFCLFFSGIAVLVVTVNPG